MMSDRHRHRSLANAARADDRDKAPGGELRREPENIVGSPDHTDQGARQVGVRKPVDKRRACARPIAWPRDRRDEAIATAREGGDISPAVLSLPQRLAHAGDVKS